MCIHLWVTKIRDSKNNLKYNSTYMHLYYTNSTITDTYNNISYDMLSSVLLMIKALLQWTL